MAPSRLLIRTALLAVTLHAHAVSAQSASARLDTVIARDERPDAMVAKPIAAAGAVLLDVRSQGEWEAGHATGAVHIPWTKVDDVAAAQLPDKNAPIIVYCAVGTRAWWAARSLRSLGYTRVIAMSGGYNDMVKAGYPTQAGSGSAKKPS